MDKTKVTAITAACGVLAVIFGLWEKAKPILAELPGIIAGWTNAQLFGFGSFIVSVGIGFGVWWLLWVNKQICPVRPHSCSDLWSVAAGWGIYVAQQVIAGGTARQMAYAVIMGMFSGLMAFLFSRIAWHFLAPPKGAGNVPD